MEDIILVCKECGQKFVFSAEEQEFYARNGFKSQPTKCLACRKAKKAESELEATLEILRNPEKYEVKCRICGRVFVTMYNQVLPAVALICPLCAPEEFELIHPQADLTLNQRLGYPKYKG